MNNRYRLEVVLSPTFVRHAGRYSTPRPRWTVLEWKYRCLDSRFSSRPRFISHLLGQMAAQAAAGLYSPVYLESIGRDRENMPARAYRVGMF